MRQKRRDARIQVAYPMTGEKTHELDQSLHPAVARVYERIKADTSGIGEKFSGTVRDLSTNGAFISAAPLPLLSRVAVKFELKTIGSVDAVGWVLWQRAEDCELPAATGTITLPKGFGVLFESIPLEIRSAIAALVSRS